MKYSEEADQLKRSSWPRCDQLALALAAKGASAADALEFATTSRTHHVRSAALKGLFQVDATRGAAVATRLLTDKAYEVRETSSILLGLEVPK